MSSAHPAQPRRADGTAQPRPAATALHSRTGTTAGCGHTAAHSGDPAGADRAAAQPTRPPRPPHPTRADWIVAAAACLLAILAYLYYVLAGPTDPHTDFYLRLFCCAAPVLGILYSGLRRFGRHRR